VPPQCGEVLPGRPCVHEHAYQDGGSPLVVRRLRRGDDDDRRPGVRPTHVNGGMHSMPGVCSRRSCKGRVHFPARARLGRSGSGPTATAPLRPLRASQVAWSRTMSSARVLNAGSSPARPALGRLPRSLSLRKRVGVVHNPARAREVAAGAIREAAVKMNHPPDLINVALETLVSRRRLDAGGSAAGPSRRAMPGGASATLCGPWSTCPECRDRRWTG
jgi:hypothetical protein